jgi:hypothetical protein
MPNYIFSNPFTRQSNPDGRNVFYIFKETLKQAGWTVPSSSNGTVFSAGDILSSSATFGNNSWFILRQPTGSYGNVQREIAIQNSTNDVTWRAKYSYSASFTGSADAITTPNAPDQVRIIGGELPAFGYEGSFFTTNAGIGWRMFVCADTEPPYSFYLVTIGIGGIGGAGSIFLFDGMQSGSYNLTDNDPYVFYFTRNFPGNLEGSNLSNNMQNPVTASAVQTPVCWTLKNTPQEAFGGISLVSYSSQQDTSARSISSIDNSIATSTYDAIDMLLPGIWFRPSISNPTSGGGYKGISSLIQIPTSAGNLTGATFSTVTSGSRDRILIKNITLPWNGTEPLI